MPTLTITPVADTSIYASGDVIDGIQTLTGAGARHSFLNNIVIVDQDGEKAPITFHFFKALPTGTYTDNAAIAINSADYSKWIGSVAVLAGDYLDVGSDAIAKKMPINLEINPTADDNLYVIPEVGSAPTYAAATDLRFDFGFL